MKPYYYVLRVISIGPPTTKHESLAQAVAESERLAVKHPGETFEILKCVGITSMPKVSTFWVDGEEPQKRIWNEYTQAWQPK